MKGKWRNLQKSLPDGDEQGKLVELKISGKETDGYINVNSNGTSDILFAIASGKHGEIFAEVTLEKEDCNIIQWRPIFI